MKQYIFTSLFLLSATIATAQVVAIQNVKDNRLWLCVDNLLLVAVEGESANAISISTDNGSVESLGRGRYIYRAKTAGWAMMYVKRQAKNGSETVIDSVQYSVRRLPNLTAKFAGKQAGSLPHLYILAQLGLIAGIDVDIDLRHIVASYSVSVYRNGIEIYKRDVQGPLIDETTNNFFYTLQNKDQLKFTDVKVKDCDGELLPVNSIEITVTNAGEYKQEENADTDVMSEDPLTGEMYMRKFDSNWKLIRR